MQELYPCLRSGVKLRTSASGPGIVDVTGGNEYRLSAAAAAVFALCDGSKNIRGVADDLAEEWEFDPGEILDFLVDAAKRGFVLLSPDLIPTPVRIVGDPELDFPHIVSLEITTTCNIACTYCYGCYGPEKKEHFPFERVPEFFDMLADRGVSGIEITGGEPLAHPRFADLYRAAFERFNLVSLISNGILWKPMHFEILENAGNRRKAYVQISIDGSDEATNALVRQKRYTFEKTVSTIRRLVELDVLCRVAYVVTRENAHDLRSTALLLRELGVKMFAVSVADGIGRGAQLTYADGKSLVNYTSPEASEIIQVVTDVNEEFQDILYNIRRIQGEYEQMFPGEDVRTALHNCGAGHAMVAVRSNGDITGCQYMQEGVAHLGNILEGDPTKAFNEEKSRLMRSFYKDASDPACMHCSYNGFCANCMVRIYEANRERLAAGKGLCGVVRRNGLDRVFDFNLPTMHNVSGLVQIGAAHTRVPMPEGRQFPPA
ncbi:MAG: radical SAM protein [Bryobacterales bacterium]|nr:radical SAM protein [Bryobacterales bacterium]